jgi:hypothetical protein
MRGTRAESLLVEAGTALVVDTGSILLAGEGAVAGRVKAAYS